MTATMLLHASRSAVKGDLSWQKLTSGMMHTLSAHDRLAEPIARIFVIEFSIRICHFASRTRRLIPGNPL